MTTKEIFLEKLRIAGYKNVNASREDDFDKKLVILEMDRENVFKAMYGEDYIKDRGIKQMREWTYRLLEAERDVKSNFIKMTMHYLIMQIHNNDLKI